MNKKKKPSAFAGGGGIFPTRSEIENLLNIDPAEILETPPLQTPSKKEIEKFLKTDGTVLKNKRK